MLRGTGVSPGVARGKALVIACGYRSAAPRRSIQPSEVEGERLRFDAALATAAAELATLQDDVNARLGKGQADIFGAQALAVDDPELRDRVLRRVREKLINV